MKISAREKDGAWQGIIRYVKNGKEKWESKQGFNRKKDALAWAEKRSLLILEDIRDNIDGGDMTLRDLMERYKEYVSLNFRPSTLSFTISTIHFLEKHATSLLDKPISKIKPIDLNFMFQRAKQTTGFSYHQQSVKIRTMFNFAVKDLRALRENPCNAIPNARKDERIKYIDEELYNRILNSIEREDIQLLVKVLKNTGLRISEAMAITKDRIRSDRIIVDRQWRRQIQNFAELKTTNSAREVPLPRTLYKELCGLKISDVHGRLFLFSEGVVSHHLRKFGVSPHCFRHTYASNLVADGWNLKTVADILGDTLDTVIQTYVHSSPIEKEKVFAAIHSL